MKKQHSCELCGAEFSGRSNLMRHLERIRKCNTKTSFTCNWCNKSFSNNSHLTRHHTTCPAKKEHDMLQEEIKTTNDNLENLVNRVDRLEKKISQSPQQLPASTTNNNTNTPDISGTENNQLILNGNNGHNTLDNSQDNSQDHSVTDNSQTTISGITINNYGSECMEHMTLKRISFVFNKSCSSVLECVKLKHFSPHAPQNKNVCIKDLKSKYAYIFCDGNWDVVGRKTLIDDMYETICDYLKEKMNEYSDEINVKKIRDFLEKRYDDATELQVKDDLMMLLFNKRN
jgi:hypothetical protein